jgi:heat-inducible transcriptional repressor
MGWVARLAADLTNEAGVVVRPVGEGESLEAMTVVDLGGRKVLGVTVTTDGRVYRRVAGAGEGLRFDRLQRLAARVSSELRGQRIDVIRLEVANLPTHDVSVRRSEADTLGELLPPNEKSEVQVAGAENLLDDRAFDEIDRLRSVVKVLQDRPGIAAEWRRALRSKPTRVFIGRESRLTESGNLGMVATLFYRGDRSVGAVGIVGPRGMNYRRVVPVVECIGESLSSFLTA